jgi:hypothetical protein
MIDGDLRHHALRQDVACPCKSEAHPKKNGAGKGGKSNWRSSAPGHHENNSERNSEQDALRASNDGQRGCGCANDGAIRDQGGTRSEDKSDFRGVRKVVR